MTQHYTRLTVSAAHYCSKCRKQTQHRIDRGRKGPCLECIARLDLQHDAIDFEELRRKLSPPPQISLFER
jgi:hypothetical protein